MLSLINKLMWAFVVALIFISSIYFTFKLKGVQFEFKEMFFNLFKKNSQKGITPIQSFFMTLGSRIGVGSIAGVSLALYIGGPGTLFWMWISAFLAAIITFAETILGIIYQKKDGLNYKGGPSYYIKYGLNKPILGGIYALLILISYVGGFVGIQGNTITKSILEIVKVPPCLIGILLVIITAFIIYGGLEKIAKYSSKIVPFMTFLYIGTSLYIISKNVTLLPAIIKKIFISAFSLKSIYGGFLSSLIIGMQRGIFSNEAGLGTGSITSSTVSANSPVSQGYVQILGVYITTLLICTSTALIVMTSNYNTLVLNDVNGIELTQYAFKYHLGYFGNILLFISILLFSFTTILTGYYDGESSLKYFIKNIKPIHLNILKIASLILLFVGTVLPSTFLWNIVDILMAILACINIYALIKLREDIFCSLKKYKFNLKGKNTC